MDTRAKIVASGAVRGRGATAVVGRFDLLTAELVEDLEWLRAEAPGTPLVAIVAPCGEALLPDRARAEMAASLAVIDYVLLPETEDIEGLLADLQPSRTIRREAADARLVRDLKTHVRQRHAV